MLLALAVWLEPTPSCPGHEAYRPYFAALIEEMAQIGGATGLLAACPHRRAGKQPTNLSSRRKKHHMGVEI